jgi:hypothetical protein
MRDPLSDARKNGRIINPPRYAHLGGLSSGKKAISKNEMTIKQPGSTIGPNPGTSDK